MQMNSAMAQPKVSRKLKIKKAEVRELPINGPVNSGSAPCGNCNTCQTKTTDY